MTPQDITNQVSAGRGKSAEHIGASESVPLPAREEGTFSPSTAYRMEECQAVKGEQVGDGTGSGGTDD